MPTKDPGQAYVGKIRNGKKLKWRPHPVMLSINVDAATDIEKKFARLGAIIRDLNDKVVAAAVRNSELWTDTVLQKLNYWNGDYNWQKMQALHLRL